MGIILVKPNENYKKEFIKNESSFDGCSGLEEVSSFEEWMDFDNRLKEKYGESYVPSIQYLGIREEDDTLVGMIDLRTKLNDFLLNFGGNIGYSILPSERKKGYAKKMLSLMIEECKKLNYDKVLLCCDKENIASSKTIIANGGIFENEVKDTVGLTESGTIQRYWINL